MIKIERGKTIFESSAQTLVNTVNCVGVMGKGLALEFKNRYPAMFDKYKSFCDKGAFKPGVLWIYKAEDGKWVLNFPTKIDWKNPSKIEYLEEGLKKFVEIWSDKGITSVAFPLLGCTNGGLNPDEVIPLMEKYLNQCEGLDVTIYDDREPIIEDSELPNPKELVSENVDPIEVVAESAPLVDEEPEVKSVDVPGVIQVEEEEKVEKKYPEEVKVPETPKQEVKYSEEQEILNEIVAERRAINQEVDKVLNEFAGSENTPEVRKEITKKLYNVINRRGFPVGSIFQI